MAKAPKYSRPILSIPKMGLCLTMAMLYSEKGSVVSAFGGMAFVSRRRERLGCLFSSTGDSLPPPPPDDGGDNGEFGDFLNPKQESEQLRRARDYMSEQSLPLSFNAENNDEAGGGKGGEEGEGEEENVVEGIVAEEDASEVVSKPEDSSALVGPGSLAAAARGGPLLDGPSQEALAKNPYMQVVSKLSPSELISKFTATANPRVQDAVRNTVLGLIGSLPKMAFDTTTITTGQRLASLMFQLQMTGYMFKNADYRLSLSQSLGGMDLDNYQYRLAGSEDSSSDDEDEPYPVDGKIRGKLKLKYGGGSSSSSSSSGPSTSDIEEDAESQNSTSTLEMEVDAAAYMSELRSEVQQLRDELMRTQQSKEDAIRRDLLLYIRTLPEQELRSLTNTMSQDVLVSMKGLVNAVMSGIGDGQITADTVTEQSGEAMAQLCMWQLVVGYNLRELEVREEMKKNLLNGFSPDTDGGVDLSEPGTLE